MVKFEKNHKWYVLVIKRGKFKMLTTKKKNLDITKVLQSKKYTKRSIPTLKQIWRFLKKEKGVSAEALSTLTMDNVCQKWNTLS